MSKFHHATGWLEIKRYGDGCLYRLHVDGEEHMVDRDTAQRLMDAETASPLSASQIRELAGLPLMTADEFERQYAERSGITVEELRALGRVVRRCQCGTDDCEGWQSVNGAMWDEAEWPT